MALWGKLFGGTAGFAVGGPLGSLMGIALGHLADKKQLLTPLTGTWGEHFNAHGTPDPNNAVFFTTAKIAALLGKKDQLYGLGVVTLSAKMAKIDGPVSHTEINAFRTCFRFPEENLKEVGLLFDKARERTDDFEMYAIELGKAFKDDPEPLETLLSVLFRIARSDLPTKAPLHPKEEDFLKRVHKAFKLSNGAWERAASGQPRSSTEANAPDAYRVLGLTRTASNEEVRTRWRSLIRKHHPDVLAQKNLSAKIEEEKARERIAHINAAWDRIKRDRGL